MSISGSYKDKEFFDIVDHILKHEKFLETKEIMHHGINRYNHSMRVSYYSYKISKLLKLDYKDTARGGLLHDFFLNEEHKDTDGKMKIMVKHPQYALENANVYFDLSDKEQDIIRTHMFPITAKPPKYLESWIVDIVDDIASIYEKFYTVSKQVFAATNFMFLILLNSLR